MPRRESPKQVGGPLVAVEIDELVLHGFPRARRDAIASAFGERLVELIREHGAPATVHTLSANLDAGAFPLKAGASPHDVGRAAAQSVYQAIRGGER